MVCKVETDEHGTTYIIPEDNAGKTPGGHRVLGCAELQVWWARKFGKDKSDELLLIKQDNRNGQADVIEMSFGQLYDMIEALNKAVENI